MPKSWHLYTQDEAIQATVDCLNKRGIAAFPTETVYGLGALSTDNQAVRRLFIAKKRPFHKPLILHFAHTINILHFFPDIPFNVRKMIFYLMPGPITFILPWKNKKISTIVTADLNTTAVRVPSHPISRAILQQLPAPLAATSANLSGLLSPTTAKHVHDDLQENIDCILDGGMTSLGLESSIIDLSTDPPCLRRRGSFALDEIKKFIPNLDIPKISSVKHHADYSSVNTKFSVPIWFIEGHDIYTWLKDHIHESLNKKERILLITFKPYLYEMYKNSPYLIIKTWPEYKLDIHKQLYKMLRNCDTYKVARLILEGFPCEDEFLPLRDCLYKFATFIINTNIKPEIKKLNNTKDK